MCNNGNDVVKVPNIALKLNQDVCLDALTKNDKAQTEYTVEFQDGKLQGNNFANASTIFTNS